MSLNGVVEFAIHIDGFRNIDLFHQGLYQVRICIYHEKDGQKVFAHPYHTSEKPIKDSKKKDNKPIIGPHILDETSSYVTRTFLIRFCDEETDFNEVCHFRTEYDAFPELAETNFYIEAELMFADLAKLSQPKNGQDDTLASFKCISLFKAKLNNIQAGVHEYLPILFDDNHFCILQTMFHAVLLDLKFRTSPIEVPREQPPVNGQEKKPPVVFIPPAKNFAEFLTRNTQNFKPIELDKFYNYYIKALRKSYEKLVEFHAYILKICLLGKNKQEFLKFYEKAPFFSLIEPYIGQSGQVNKIHSIFSDLKEEVKIPEKPKGLFEGAPVKKISDELNPSDPASISHTIMQEVNVIAGNTFQTWYLLMDMMQEAPKFITNLLKEEYHKQLKDRWGESIFQQTYKVSDLAISFEQKVGESHKQIASARRNNLYYKVLDLYHAIEDINMFPKAEFHPILFEEIYVKEVPGQEKSAEALLADTEKNLMKCDYRGVHLIVFSHGFQGNSFDLRLFKNNISYLYPDTLFLCASANEDLTDGEIVGMGLRLANEVKNYIEEWVPGNNLGRLSFIGHSLGGLIIRSALPHLEQFAPKMHLFMTLSSPHLGYMYNSSKIIDAGMWFLKKWKKSVCLTELTMTDAQNMEDTYLFKLSKNKGLEWFKTIVLMSSYQDMYAPFESARIQTSKKATQESTRGSVWANMAKNILSHVTTDCVYRIDINFKLEEKNLDTMIGRAAHIKFLESQALMRMVTYRYANFFS